MEILILSHLVPYPTTSGVLLRCYNLLREVAREHRVHLYALNQGVLLEPGAPLEASVEHLRSFCAEVQVFPIPTDGSRGAYGRLLLGNLFSRHPYSVPRFYAPALEEAVIDLLSRRPVEIVQFETIAMAQYGALAPDLPQILVHQNVESELLARRARAERNPLTSWYLHRQAARLARCEESFLRHCDAHVAVSESDRRQFLACVPDARVEVVVNGVDVDYFRPGPRPEGGGAGLVFAGGMSWYPNADAMHWFLTEIWPRILEARPDATVTMIGSHPSAEARRAAAADPERVRVTGLVPDIRPYVDEASLYVCPFRVGGGTRLKILDAWSQQKALVSTTVGCEGLDAVSGRDLVIADSAQDFAAAVVALLGDATRRRQLGEAGRLRAERDYAWPHVARGMLDLYASLVAAHRGGAPPVAAGKSETESAAGATEAAVGEVEVAAGRGARQRSGQRRTGVGGGGVVPEPAPLPQAEPGHETTDGAGQQVQTDVHEHRRRRPRNVAEDVANL
ncbi:MAG: glycosyltransferase [Candidatus Eiseniibacteriota bacterium]|jgi:glycosyltransferase involved in cell wall biosynthesis